MGTGFTFCFALNAGVQKKTVPIFFSDSLREFLSQSRKEGLRRKLIEHVIGEKLDFWEQM